MNRPITAKLLKMPWRDRWETLLAMDDKTFDALTKGSNWRALLNTP